MMRQKEKDKLKKNIAIGVLLLIVLVALGFIGGIFSIVSTSEQGSSLSIVKPSLCITRAGKSDVCSNQGNTAIFGDYKLVLDYSSRTYSASCKSPPTTNVKSNVQIGVDKYNCPIYETITKSYTYTSCTGGSNCPSYRSLGVTMCTRCTAKGVCDGTTFSCNGCSDTGWSCFGSKCNAYGGSCYWDYCGCSRITTAETKTYTGGYSLTSRDSVGFTYSLYYKDNLISSRTDFAMSNFNAIISSIPAKDNSGNTIANVYSTILKMDRLCLKDGSLQADLNDCDYEVGLSSYGGKDSNGDKSFTVDVDTKISDAKLSAVFDMNNSYVEGADVKLPLTVINNYGRPIKVRLTLNYAFDTFLGNLNAPISYMYDIPIGNTELNVPFSTQKTTDKVTITPTLEYYDTGMNGVAIHLQDRINQYEFLTPDAYTAQYESNYRAVVSEDWVTVKTQNFQPTTVTIRAKYSDEDISFIQMSLAEKALYLKTQEATIAEISAKIASAGLTIKEQTILITQLTDDINSQKQYIEQLIALRLKNEGQINDLQAQISLQAEYINDLTTNLAIKAQLVDGLQVENVHQAELIREMKLSFTNQAGIIDALNKTTNDDAVIIKNLNLSLENEGKVLSAMKATVEEKIQIIESLKETVENEEIIVAELKQNNEDLKKTIDALNLDEARLQKIINAKNETIGILFCVILVFIVIVANLIADLIRTKTKRTKRSRR